jgi:hypothetical protein
MAKFIVLHEYKGDPDQSWKDLSTPEGTKDWAMANASGSWPAKCISSWYPYKYGRKEFFCFCLWEGKSVEDVKTSLGELLNYVTGDIFQVDEIVWAEFVKKGAA